MNKKLKAKAKDAGAASEGVRNKLFYKLSLVKYYRYAIFFFFSLSLCFVLHTLFLLPFDAHFFPAVMSLRMLAFAEPEGLCSTLS